MKLITQATAARENYSKLINTRLANSSVQQKCDYTDIVSELVYQGTSQLENIKHDIADSNLSVRAVLPNNGIQYGPFGEVIFDPSNLLITRPTPPELEMQLKNLGNEKEQVQEDLVKKFNKRFGVAVDINEPKKLTEKDCRRINDLMKAKRESLNKQLVKAIDTRCAVDREALLQTKLKFKRL